MLPLFVVFAQSAKAERQAVRGTVTDQNGKPVRGASVKLKALQTLQIRSFISGQDGGYRFHGLNPRFDYDVWADFGDWSSRVVRLDQFESKVEVIADLQLRSSSRHAANQQGVVV
jgi:hypothetical protein